MVSKIVTGVLFRFFFFFFFYQTGVSKDCLVGIMYYMSVCLYVIRGYLGNQKDDVIQDTLERLKAKHSSVSKIVLLQFPIIE